MSRIKFKISLITLFLLVLAPSVWSSDLNCPGGRWVGVSSSHPKDYSQPVAYPCSAGCGKYSCETKTILSGDIKSVYTCYFWAACEYCNCACNQWVDTYEWKCPCTAGQTQACSYSGPAGTENVGICRAGSKTCQGGYWASCQGEVLPQQEVCGDGLDNNCDGQIDEGCGIELPETVYQCEDKFKVTPPFYDETKNSICTSGCALADVTMVLNYYLNKAGLPMVDMEELNEWLNLNEGYYDGGKINWSALNEYPGANVKFVKSSDIEDVVKLNEELTKGYPVILKVFNPKTGRDHFIVAVGKNGETWDIIDPGYQPQETTLAERYGNHFKGVRIYESYE
ncbi:MAG: C39 family peptidase [Deltaproteobacteria bacterium]|nr:C39 family peptidase [Deltaproteobacteria bacterium]